MSIHALRRGTIADARQAPAAGGTISLVQSKGGGTSTATPASMTVAFDAATTTGNTVLLVTGSDNVMSTPSGWTLDRSQVNSTGHYVFRRTSAGETSWSIPIGSAPTSWALLELSGVHASTPLAAVNSAGSTSNTATRSTGTAGPTSGATGGLAVASWTTSNPGGSSNSLSGYTSSFTERVDVTCSNGGTNTTTAVATLAVAADGSFESTATLAVSRPCTGIMAVYRPA